MMNFIFVLLSTIALIIIIASTQNNFSRDSHNNEIRVKLSDGINCLKKTFFVHNSSNHSKKTMINKMENTTKSVNKRIKRLILENDSTSEDRSLRKRQRQRNNDEIEELLNVLPSDLINLTELEVELKPHWETIAFNSVEGGPQQNGFYYGESSDSKKTINLLSTEESGWFASIVDTNNNAIYLLQPDYDGKTRIMQKSTSDFTESDDEIDEISDQEQELDFYEVEEAKNDHGDTIDIMVVWTKNAECRNSWRLRSCTLTDVTRNNMLGKIRLAIAETNIAFALSGINTKLRLVHTYMHPTYQEFGRQASQRALFHITQRFGGKLDDVHENRAKYGADIVSFWVDSYVCGMSWNGPSKHRMFSIVSWKCATGYFSFGHEIAHNLGCHHDRGSEDKCSKNYWGINYGYRDKNSAFRDIMAYNCVSGQCDNNAGLPCARVQRFSNTYLSYDGLPIGDERNNCARHINSKLSVAASFYASKTDEELAIIRASDEQKENPTFRNPSCKPKGKHCSPKRNNLCCSGECKFRKCYDRLR